MKNPIFNPASTSFSVLSYGAGQDSTAILFKLIHDTDFRKKYLIGKLLVLFSDTGNEHPETYHYLKYVQEICRKHDIDFRWLKPSDGYHPESWNEGLTGHYKKYNVIMSKAMPSKSCSVSLKISPIYNFLSEYVNDLFLFGMSQPKRKIALKDYAIRYGKINVLLGISHEEANRRINNSKESNWMKIAVNKVYPLVSEQMTR